MIRGKFEKENRKQLKLAMQSIKIYLALFKKILIFQLVLFSFLFRWISVRVILIEEPENNCHKRTIYCHCLNEIEFKFLAQLFKNLFMKVKIRLQLDQIKAWKTVGNSLGSLR